MKLVTFLVHDASEASKLVYKKRQKFRKKTPARDRVKHDNLNLTWFLNQAIFHDVLNLFYIQRSFLLFSLNIVTRCLAPASNYVYTHVNEEKRSMNVRHELHLNKYFFLDLIGTLAEAGNNCSP
ncbi:MAG: hypothetical protein ACTSVI_11245 [Promethearchaeota archaeon]